MEHPKVASAGLENEKLRVLKAIDNIKSMRDAKRPKTEIQRALKALERAVENYYLRMDELLDGRSPILAMKFSHQQVLLELNTVMDQFDFGSEELSDGALEFLEQEFGS